MPSSRSDLRYRRLFETIHVGILLLDYNTRVITDANPFIARLSGYKTTDLIGKKISQIKLFNDTLTGKKIFKDLETQHEVIYDNIPLTGKHGVKIVELSAHTYQSNGTKMIQCIVRDLTEKRKAQTAFYETSQRLEALMNALPVGVTFSLDPKVKNVEVNPYMKKKMEMEPGTQITATDRETMIVGHTYKHFDKDGREMKPKELTLQRAIAENRLVGPIEADVELPSGKRWHIEAYGAPIRNSQGKVIGAVAVNVDTTQRKKAEEAEKLALIVNQEKEKLAFIADATHELRTPLAIIRGNVDLALQKKVDKDEALQSINVEVIHLSSILSDLALLTTKEGDFRKNMSSHLVEVGKVVKDIAERHKSMASKKNISIKVSKLPTTKIIGDDYYLERLFTNIISNAIAYGKEAGHIEISGEIVNKCVKISIKDDGVGISEKDLPLIFERFYRAEESRSKDFGGSGLGLAIVKWIAEAHGGSVECQSKLGEGSTFTVSLPFPKKK